ncbi:MAG: tetratricopeptide repeat protein [Candidatus Zixiibacteriota bacterium]|nr:MAG: tetratricopeptide repeat protein [candidate division Zixibacteria bacterium]
MRLFITLLTLLCIFNVADTDDNIPRLNRAVSENPDDFDAVRQLVEIFIEQRNYASADSILSEYLAKSAKQDAYATYLQGRLLDLKEDVNRAIDKYLQAIEMDSTLWQACRDLAYLYDIFSEYETMNSMLQKSIDFAPIPESLYYDYGYSFDMMGRLDSAEYYYHRAIDFDSLDHQAYLNLGAIMGLSGNLDSAKFLLEKAVMINPGSPEAFYNLGEVSVSLGLFDNAAGYFQQALALDSGLFAAKKRLGDIFEIMGDSGMARLYYEDFLNSTPIIYMDDINEVRLKLDNYK